MEKLKRKQIERDRKPTHIYKQVLKLTKTAFTKSETELLEKVIKQHA